MDDDSLLIQHGRFYTQDDYPDIELFATAASLVRKFAPDYLLIHPMGMDYMGEKYGANSSEYRNHAIRQDMWMSTLIAEWMERGYNILVTGDHGMNADRLPSRPSARRHHICFISTSPQPPGRLRRARLDR